MTITEAKKNCKDYYALTNPSEEDRFLFTESLQFLIEETKDSNYMVELGAMYYAQRDFDLALKYYEMAASYDNRYAISDLGYIWYYGRTGEKNYEKAYHYFSRASEMGDMIATYKVADMYKNGYFVEKDYGKYKAIINKLYRQIKNARRLDMPLPEVFTRRAKICSEEGDKAEALRLYDTARDFLEQRIQYNPFFGNLTIMKWLIRDTYKLREFDTSSFGLYDLYYLLESPVKVRFYFEDEAHCVFSTKEDEYMAICFDNVWYRTVDDFFKKARIANEQLTTLYEELYGFEILDT